MVYHAALDQILLFDGRLTWEWNGRDWIQLQPPNSPPGRTEFAMVYHAATQRTLLFGGTTGGNAGTMNDTWEWDGATWTQLSPPQRPRTRRGHSLVYDPLRRRSVLFGGIQSDTWEWDGSAWVVRFPGRAPTRRRFHAMAWHPGRQTIVLHGGTVVGGQDSSETWEWTGSTWVFLGNQTPRARRGHFMVADHADGEILMYGGVTGPPTVQPTFLDETWRFTTAGTWQRLIERGDPRRWSSGVFDRARGITILLSHFSTRDELWEWNGVHWSSPPSVGGPYLPSAAAADLAGPGVLVLAAGSTSMETWEWDGQVWTRHRPANQPGLRDRHVMAYDSVRDRVVLFGGNTQSGPVGDTWEWDGNDWLRRSPANAPSPRHSVGLAFDRVRNLTVLTGGTDARGGGFSGTWEWNGTDWTGHLSAVASAGYNGVDWHDGLQRVVSAGIRETTAWDGTQWRRVAGGVGGLFSPVSLEEPFGRFLKVGNGFSPHVTWLLGVPAQAATSAVGTGCAGGAGVPQLSTSLPILHRPVSVDLERARPASLCGFFWDTRQASIGLGGGCTQIVAIPHLLDLRITNGAGFAGLTLTIPEVPVFRGAQVVLQAAVADPQGAWAGVALSQGARVVLGNHE